MGVDVELHSSPLQPGGWWACFEPERRPQEFKTAFDQNCPRCVIGMRAAVATGIFPVETWWHHNAETGAPERRMSPIEVLEMLRLT